MDKADKTNVIQERLNNLVNDIDQTSPLINELIDKVDSMEKQSLISTADSANSSNSMKNKKPEIKSLKIKEEIVHSDSPPSSNTRIGVEAKKWLEVNPELTHTLESQLKCSNTPILRKIIALEKAKTPQKKSFIP